MGFFKDFKDDFSQAINELLPGEDYPESDEIQVNTLGSELDVEKELSKLDGLLEQVEKRSGQAAPTNPLSEKAEPEKLDALEDDDWEMPKIRKLEPQAFEPQEESHQADVLEFPKQQEASKASETKPGPRFVTPKNDLPELDDEWDDLDLFELPQTKSEKKVPDFLKMETLTEKKRAFDAELDKELDQELEKEFNQELSAERQLDRMKKELEKREKQELERKELEKKELAKKEFERKERERKEFEQKERERKEREQREREQKELERKAREKQEREQREHERKEREQRELEKREAEKKEQEKKERLRKQMQEYEFQNKTAAEKQATNESIREEQRMDTMMTGATTETTTAAAAPVEMPISMSSTLDGDVTEEVSVITAGTKIRGNMETTGSFEIEGTIEGDIKCNGKLTVIGRVVGNSSASEFFADAAHVEGEVVSTGTVKVGLGSVIIGNIAATSAVIAGAVKGDIDVQGPVVVDTSAVIMGNIKSRSVQINNGAVIEGFCSQSYSDVDVESLFSNKNK